MIRRIRLIIIDDSLFFRDFLKRNLEKDPQIDIVGVFGDPVEAQSKIHQLRPDVMTVDMEMPKIRGDQFLQMVLPANPGVQAIVISALSSNVFDAMHAGAVDFVGKPNFQPGYDNTAFIEDITHKLKAAAAARPRPMTSAPPPPVTTAPPRTAPARTAASPLRGTVSARNVIAIGASTGGTEALIQVLNQFPANAPGVVIVQHMPPVFTRMFAERIDKTCPMQCREAKNGDRVEQGLILIAPGGDQQMRIKSDSRGYYVHLSAEAKVSGHCPSVDVLFESVALAAGANAVGVILTGMGGDGAKNLLKMRQAGAHTIGQDEESCIVYGMPKVAYELGAVVEQLPLSAIGNAVMRRYGLRF